MGAEYSMLLAGHPILVFDIFCMRTYLLVWLLSLLVWVSLGQSVLLVLDMDVSFVFFCVVIILHHWLLSVPMMMMTREGRQYVAFVSEGAKPNGRAGITYRD